MQALPRCWADGNGSTKLLKRAAALVGVVVLLLQALTRAAAKDDWLPIEPNELAETTPRLLADAAGEILFLKVEIDDSDFPTERVRREYIRAKIYKPEHIEELTRISGREVSDDSYLATETKVKLSAKLTLPDGTTKLFGDEAIRERMISQSGEKNLLDRLLGLTGQQVKERFLAVGGAEAGAILEYKIERREHSSASPYDVLTFQRRGMAIRQVQLTASPPNARDWNYRYFVLNPAVAHAKLQEDLKRKTLTLEASDVPPLTEEPLAGPTSYHALSLMSCYEKKERHFIARHAPVSYTIDPAKTGIWSMYSITDYMALADRIEITTRIRKLVAEVTADAKDPEEKAKRIHDRLHAMYFHYLKESRYNKTELTQDTITRSLDDLLEYDRKSSVAGIYSLDYLALGTAMYKEVGLESRVLLLPDRRMAPFNRKLASRVFVSQRALAVKLGDRWVYSMPTVPSPLSFGDIPWYCEGQVALVVKNGPEEFTPVPYSEGGKSLIGNGGAFELKSDGTLTGTAKRKYTGHAAFAVRQRLFNRDAPRQRAILARQISRDFKVGLKRSKALDDEDSDTGDEHLKGFVAIKSISGLDTPETPIEIEYVVTLPDFASVAGQRLIFRPWLFRANEINPFTSDTRTTNIYFPYARQELDVATIRLPPGFKPEFSDEKAPSSGQALHYKTTLSFDAESGTLKLRREYASNLVALPVSIYPQLKEWYDTMTRIDQQEVVATASSASGPSPSTKPTALADPISTASETAPVAAAATP